MRLKKGALLAFKYSNSLPGPAKYGGPWARKVRRLDSCGDDARQLIGSFQTVGT